MISSMPSRRRPVVAAAAAVVIALVLAACQAEPLSNPQGTSAGLAATSDRAAAVRLIDRVDTAGRGPKTGYDRDEFGSGWLDSVDVAFGRNGCDARNDILERDLTGETFRAGTGNCVVETGRLDDPYTGTTISFTKAQATKVQIDHVVPLSYAWQMGAARWTDAKRRAFANDPLNLMAVDGPTNSAKGDSGPASWLPPNRSIRCSYAVRYAQVVRTYDLPVTTADKAMMRQQCA